MNIEIKDNLFKVKYDRENPNYINKINKIEEKKQFDKRSQELKDKGFNKLTRAEKDELLYALIVKNNIM